jgi:PKD repeat protein
MKKVFLIPVILSFCFYLSAQISEGGLPRSYKSATVKGVAPPACYNLAKIDTAGLLAYNAENPFPLRYGVLEEVSIDMKSAGTRTMLSDGGTVWQYRINSETGKSVQVIFKKYLVPEGAELYLFDEKFIDVRGAFTELNMTGNLMFVTGDIPGNHVIVEYYEPAGVSFGGEVIIGWLGQSYIDIFAVKSRNEDARGFIPVNCDEGKDLQNQKHSVCKYSFNDGMYSYLCSGALINNTKNDGTPYFLTANHCINTEAEAGTVLAYFNYEDASCVVTSRYTAQTLSGASVRTMGAASDFTLIRFNDQVPSFFQPYFAGWDISGAIPLNTSCIHHPDGNKKKISIDKDPAVSYEDTITWEGGSVTPAGSHWEVVFDEGTTYSGSSGGPLFNESRRITGQLHGGSAKDYFGKLSYSWEHQKQDYLPLQLFLDPDNTGVTVNDGYYPPDNLPDANFLSGFRSVCVDSPIELTGLSAFDPLTWQWSFFPSSVIYHEGTGSDSQSPKVSFTVKGSYRVSLRVTNSYGFDVQAIDNFISAGSNLSVEAYTSGLTDSCTCSFTGVSLQAYGADAYLWSLSQAADDYFYIENSTANPAEIKLIDGVQLTRSTDIEIILTGIQGTCQNTLQFKIPLTAQANDNIADAIEIGNGKNGPYSNLCATVEEGEPVPPFDSCTGQLSWCDEYGTGKNIVEKSVWFHFTPTVNQTISLYSTGFDDQVAVYRASTYQDVLSGKYTLVGANDDYTDADYNPRITSINVSAGQKYWVQVDGSGGGVTGTFFLNMSVLSGIDDTHLKDEKIKVWPQPAEDIVTFESEAFTPGSPVKIELLDFAGKLICQETFTDISGSLQLSLGNLASGVYFARIFQDNRVSVVKVVRH